MATTDELMTLWVREVRLAFEQGGAVLARSVLGGIADTWGGFATEAVLARLESAASRAIEAAS